jgi:hypothetical protein
VQLACIEENQIADLRLDDDVGRAQRLDVHAVLVAASAQEFCIGDFVAPHHELAAVLRHIDIDVDCHLHQQVVGLGVMGRQPREEVVVRQKRCARPHVA